MKEKETVPVFTDDEYRLVLAALSRERKVCKKVDEEQGEGPVLETKMNRIERKIQKMQYPEKTVVVDEPCMLGRQDDDAIDNEWLACENSMPAEYECKESGVVVNKSDIVNVTFINQLGKLRVGEDYTRNGRWAVYKDNVVAWRPKLKPYLDIKYIPWKDKNLYLPNVGALVRVGTRVGIVTCALTKEETKRAGMWGQFIKCFMFDENAAAAFSYDWEIIEEPDPEQVAMLQKYMKE